MSNAALNLITVVHCFFCCLQSNIAFYSRNDFMQQHTCLVVPPPHGNHEVCTSVMYISPGSYMPIIWHCYLPVFAIGLYTRWLFYFFWFVGAYQLISDLTSVLWNFLCIFTVLLVFISSFFSYVYKALNICSLFFVLKIDFFPYWVISDSISGCMVLLLCLALCKITLPLLCCFIVKRFLEVNFQYLK